MSKRKGAEELPKKVPVRCCSGCAEHKPKKELVRIVRTPDGQVLLDRTGKLSGRGVYICPSSGCLEKARRAKRMERQLAVPVPPEIYERLEKELRELRDTE